MPPTSAEPPKSTNQVSICVLKLKIRARQPRMLPGTRACVSLSPRGLLRWYAACCHTPLANTPRDWKLPYVGLVHTCLRQPDPLERSFPQVEMRIYTKRAHGPVPGDTGLSGKLHFLRMVMRLTGMRLTGAYKSTPLFSANGEPVAQPRVAGNEEVEDARRAAAA